MNNALAYIGGLFVLVLAALFAGPLLIDWNGYRGVFEEEASKVLGRDVRVSGDVNVRLLPSPYVRFEQVRIADTTGATGEPFVRADSFTMRLSGPPLLRGVLEARDVEFEKPVLSLAIGEDGRGNWQDLRLVAGGLPFVPRDVTLQSVRVKDGAISLFRPKVGLAARIANIEGELSADSLSGPFRFQGTAAWGGLDRAIRFATGPVDDQGRFQIKASTETQNKDYAVQLDGVVSSLKGDPGITGKIVGHQAITAVGSKDDAATDAAGTAGADATAASTLEFRSDLRGDLAAFDFDKIELSLANATVPQMMTGTARIDWTGRPKSTITLAAKWFDIDRLVGAGKGGAPFGRLKSATMSALAGLSGETDAEARIDLDQVRLGGESAGGLRIDAERRDGVVRIREFRAGLPGGSRVGLSGVIRQHRESPLFEGEGFIHGTSLSRLRAWAAKSGADIDILATGPFSVDGQVLISNTRFELTDASATIANQPMTGDVKIIDEDRYRAEITLESAQLPPGVLFPNTLAALDAEIRKALGLTTAQANANPSDQRANGGSVAANEADAKETLMPNTRGSNMDINLRLLAGKLHYGDRTLTNVDTTINLEDGNIHIPAVRATTASGLTLSAEGHLHGSETGKTGGTTGFLAFDADAPQKAALEELTALFGLYQTIGESRIASWQNARMAGSVRFGARAPGTADLSLDGLLGPARVTASAEFDSGLSAWRTAPTRIRVSADGASLQRFLAGLGHGGVLPADVARTGADAEAARIQFAAAGVLGEDTRIKGLIESDPLTLGFEGAAAWPEGEAMVLTGQTHIDSDNARHVFALAGIDAPSGLTDTSVNGDIALARAKDGWRFAAPRLTIGASTVDVKGSIDRQKDGTPRLDAIAKVDRVWLTSLLAAIRNQAADPTAPESVGTVWPDDGLAPKLFGSGTARVALSFDRFEINAGLVTGKGDAVITAAAGQIALESVSAEALGGRAEGKLVLMAVPGGTELSVDVALQNAEAAKLSPRANGRFDLALTTKGRGATLQSAVRLSDGTGTLKLNQVSAPQPTVEAVSDVIADVLTDAIPNKFDPLVAALSEQISNNAPAPFNATLGIAVHDGVAKLAPIARTSPLGTVNVENRLDLVSLKLDSAWRVAAIPPRYQPDEVPDDWQPTQYSGALPPLVVRYSGPVAMLGRVDATLDANALHRDLIILQTERSAQELARLRLLDEQRGVEEAARIEALRREAEEKRKAAIEAQRVAEEEARERARAAAAGEQLPPILPESYNSDGSTSSITDPQAQQQQPVATQPVPPTNRVEAAPDVQRRSPPPRPRVRAERRTTTDEIMRSLGGFP